MLRLVAIALIWCGCTAAWLVLGGSIAYRTSQQETTLTDGVRGLYGGPIVQDEPTASYDVVVPRVVVTTDDEGKRVKETQQAAEPRYFPLQGTNAKVQLKLDQRRKGLLWFSTFQAELTARYVVEQPLASVGAATFHFRLPAASAYEGLRTEVNGHAIQAPLVGEALQVPLDFSKGKRMEVLVHYRTGGLDAWTYSPNGKPARVRDFHLTVDTDFPDYDFPNGSLSPSKQQVSGHTAQLRWDADELITSLNVGVGMPKKTNPGPFAERISFFAPVGLLFFFFALFILAQVRGFTVHPMHYAFMGMGTFAFHLLLAYLADRVRLEYAFVGGAMVSAFLVVSYLARAVSPRFALLYAGPAHLIYLVLFSAAFFREGSTGLTLTVGAILSLFFAMQLTARIDWSERFARKPRVFSPPV